MQVNDILHLKDKKDDLIMLIKNHEKNLLDITKYLKNILGENNSDVLQKILIKLTDSESQRDIKTIMEKIENDEKEFNLNFTKWEAKQTNNHGVIKRNFYQLHQKLGNIVGTEVVLSKEKYDKLKIIMHKIHIAKINNIIIKDKIVHEINQSHLNLYIQGLQNAIKTLNQKKINPVINFLLKIFSCGFYSKNKYLTRHINTKNNELAEYLLINMQKETINQKSQTKPSLVNWINSIDFQNQPSTSKVKSSSLN